MCVQNSVILGWSRRRCHFRNADTFQPEVVGDVISGVDVHVKCGENRSNHSWDIGLPHFVMYNDDASLCRSSHEGKTPYSVLPKNNYPDISGYSNLQRYPDVEKWHSYIPEIWRDMDSWLHLPLSREPGIRACSLRLKYVDRLDCVYCRSPSLPPFILLHWPRHTVSARHQIPSDDSECCWWDRIKFCNRGLTVCRPYRATVANSSVWLTRKVGLRALIYCTIFWADKL